MDANEAVDRAKHELRKTLLAARTLRSDADLDAARAGIRDHLLLRAEQSGWARIAAYEPLRTEPGSVELLAGLDALGLDVLVPQTRPDRDLDWQLWTPESAPESRETLGREAIAGVDVVLVPALAVARSGVRLGRGGGSYDRALPRLSSDTIVAALIFDDEYLDELPRAEWDVPVQVVVTPTGWLDL